MKNTFFTIFAVLTLAACDSTSDAIFSDYRPVVEAYLVAGQPISIHISKEIPYAEDSQGTAEDLDGLIVKITTNGKTYTLIGTGSGIYTLNLLPKTGETYQLSFDYNGKVISATTQIPIRPVNYKTDRTAISRTKVDFSGGGFPSGNPFGSDEDTPIKLTWDNPSNDFHFVVADNVETSPTAIMTLPSTIPVRNFRFRNEPVSGTSSEIRPQQFQYFGKHRVILFKINPDYAALYKTNNTSSQNITTPPTEINNGLGIFTGVNADTLYVQVNQK